MHLCNHRWYYHTMACRYAHNRTSHKLVTIRVWRSFEWMKRGLTSHVRGQAPQVVLTPEKWSDCNVSLHEDAVVAARMPSGEDGCFSEAGLKQ